MSDQGKVTEGDRCEHSSGAAGSAVEEVAIVRGWDPLRNWDAITEKVTWI